MVVYGSATPRAESWELLERLDLGGRLGASLPPVRIVDLRREPGYPLSAPLLAALGEIAGRGRQGDPPPEPPRRRARDPLPRLRGDAALRALRRRAHPARRRAPALPPLRRDASGADALPELRRRRAGAPRRGHRAARGRAGRARFPELELLRLDADTTAEPTRLAEVLARFEEADRVVLLGTQMVAKGHHFAGVRLAAVVDADTGLGAAGLPRGGADVPARHAARRAQRPRRARARARPDVPAGRAPDHARRPACGRRVPLGRARPARARSATRRSSIWCSIVVSGPERDGPLTRSARAAHRAGAPRRRGSSRPGAAPAPARPAPRAASRQDGQPAQRRRAGRAPARHGRAGDAPRRPRRVVDVDPQGVSQSPIALRRRERGRRPGQGRASSTPSTRRGAGLRSRRCASIRIPCCA